MWAEVGRIIVCNIMINNNNTMWLYSDIVGSQNGLATTALFEKK
jgi:hypothetical protein